VIVLGGGALAAGPAALGLARALGAGILTTTAGKGAVREDDPHVLGSRLGTAAGQERLMAADAVLAAGTELSETDFWRTDLRLRRGLIRIDLDPDTLARPHAAEIAILGDAAETLAAILALVPAGTAPPPAALPPEPGDHHRPVLARVLATIRAALPADAILVSDMTQIAYAANEIFPVLAPRCWFHPVGFGTLGYALPAAIGARFGRPDRPVVALAGDYGFQYTLPELGTAVEHRLPLPILLWNNSLFGAIHDDMVRKRIQPNAVTLRNPDFPALARAYGAAAERPASLGALAAALAAALSAPGPTLIEMTPAMAVG
jgi:thiamine pyrophosphate-dependent acetolactate synthase large subunit-like protein